MFRALLIKRAIFRVGSLFPVINSLTLEGDTPIFCANVRCDIDSSSSRSLIASGRDGGSMGKWWFS